MTWGNGLGARLRRAPLTVVVPVWVAANLLWLRAFRWTRYAELDEAAYTAQAIRLGHAPGWGVRWELLTGQYVHGPLQAILAAPVARLVAGDVRTLIALNIVLVGVAALATAAVTRRLADPATATLAGLVVLLSPSIVEYSRTALTAVLPMTAAALALAALARSDGLRVPVWSAAAGAAIGAMLLGRSMAIGFVPMVAVAGLGWAWSRRTPWLRVAANGALTALTAVVVAAWWWWLRWDAVSTYLFEGGSSDTQRQTNPLWVLRVHLGGLLETIGLPVVATSAVASVVLIVLVRRRAARGGTQPVPTVDPGDGDPEAVGPLPVWPLVLSVTVGLLTLSASTALGVGFVLPLVPAAVAAGSVGLRRAAHGSAGRWRAAAGVVLTVALLGAVLVPGRGLTTVYVWQCPVVDERVRIQCSIDSNLDGARWRQVTDDVAVRIVTFEAAVATPGEWLDPAFVALTPRDLAVNGNSVALALETRYRATRDLYLHFRVGEEPDAQIARAVGHAGLIFAVEDPPGEVILGQHAPPTAEVAAAARAAGFSECDTIAMPDGRSVLVLAAGWVPDAACA